MNANTEAAVSEASQEASFCRLCAASVDSDARCERLYESGGETALARRLSGFLGLELSSDDGGPNAVCSGCTESLEQAVSFAARARRANDLFRKGESRQDVLQGLNCELNAISVTRSTYRYNILS